MNTNQNNTHSKPSNENLEELSYRDYLMVSGGETAWYWVSYAAGAVAHEVKDLTLSVYLFVQTNRPIGIA